MVHRAELLHAQHFSDYYHRLSPTASLAEYVDHFWLLKSYQALGDAVSESHFPRLAAEWVFVQEASVGVLAGRSDTFSAMYRPPLRRLTPFVYGSHTVAFGVRFQPGVFPDIQGVPEALNAQIQQVLRACEPANAALCLGQLQDLIQPVLATHEMPEGGTRDTVQLCQQALWSFREPEATVASMCQDLGVTPRTLRRYFQGLWGLSPKAAQRQVRLREALQYRWAQSPQAQGELTPYYSDNAHFYKSFQQICQVSLQQFLQRHA